MNNFAKYIKDLRVDKNIKLVAAADALQIDKALLSKIESGSRQATKKQVGAMIRFYKLDDQEAYTRWLGAKLVYELADESFALEALKVAEEQIKYGSSAVVDFAPDNELKKLLKEADRLKKIWSKKKPLNQIQLQKLNEHFSLKYTYESNKIEGNTLTFQETFLVVNQGLTIGGKSVNEHLEAINHAEAVEFLVQLVQNKESLTERVLQEIHYLILKGIDRTNAGKYRRVPVYISGSSFVPPQPFMVAKLIEDIFIYYHKNKNKLHPVILAAAMHEKIVTVHPFVDGNGRTCRLIMNLLLLANGYTLAVLKGDNKSRLHYYSMLEAAQQKMIQLVFINW
ncbi:MAG: Fic family protein [Crocinitomicaceae bacterium]|nr:Fic family protein [Crocinitomicaceae bacterium]